MCTRPAGIGLQVRAGTLRHDVSTSQASAAVGGELCEEFALDLTERTHPEERRERQRQAQAELVYMSRVSMMGELAA